MVDSAKAKYPSLRPDQHEEFLCENIDENIDLSFISESLCEHSI